MTPPSRSEGYAQDIEDRAERCQDKNCRDGRNLSRPRDRRAPRRAVRLARLRRLIHEACPDVTEAEKWKKPSNPAGVPVWEKDGLICTCETYKDKVKLTFARGAALKDPAGLFNASLDGNARRAIEIGKGKTIDETAFKALVRDVVTLNTAREAACPARTKTRANRA